MTAAGKITTARLTPGARILVAETLAEARGVRVLDVAQRKTGAKVATVTGLNYVAPGPHGRQRRCQILTDLGELVCSPSQTHMLAPAGDRPLSTAGFVAPRSEPVASCEPGWHGSPDARVPATFIVKVDGVDLPAMHHGSRATCTGHLERSIEDLMATYFARRVIVTRLTS